MKSHALSRAAAWVGAAALGIAAIAGGASAAYADGSYPGNIDPAAPASLTIHKYLHQKTPGVDGDISQAPAEGDFADPVKDVVFTVYPLLKDGASADLATQEAWIGLDKLQAGVDCTAPAGYTLGGGVPMPKTDADGTSTLALAQGLYMACETEAPANIVDRGLPFVLTLPMPHENEWVYNVHAYPKNGAGEIVKSVQAPGAATGIGSTVFFDIEMSIPTQTQAWKHFAIKDQLESRLIAVRTQGGVDKGFRSVTVDGVALDRTFYEATGLDRNLKVEFKPAGIAWLNAAPGNAQAGKKIKVEVAARVLSLGDGIIKNKATFTNDRNVEVVLTSNEVRDNFGSLEVQKRAASPTADKQTPLKDAVFEVYNAQDPYPTAPADCTTAVADTDAGVVAINGKKTFTSGENGIVKLEGLYVSDSTNAPVDNPTRCYVLKEVAAPAGYELPATPFTGVTVKTGSTTIVGDASDLIIFNKQVPPVKLPLTGAAGQVLLIGGGVAAIAVAGGLMVMNRRRTKAQV